MIRPGVWHIGNPQSAIFHSGFLQLRRSLDDRRTVEKDNAGKRLNRMA